MDNAKPDPAAKRATATSRVAKTNAQSLDRKEASKRIDEYIAGFDDRRGATMAQLRELIHEVNPDVVEDWKYMGSPFWSRQGMFAHGNILKTR